MKQDINNTNLQERQVYVPASVKVIEVTACRMLCQSNDGINPMQFDEDGGELFG